MHEAMELQWKWKVGVTLPLAKLFYGVEPKALVKIVDRGRPFFEHIFSGGKGH